MQYLVKNRRFKKKIKQNNLKEIRKVNISRYNLISKLPKDSATVLMVKISPCSTRSLIKENEEKSIMGIKRTEWIVLWPDIYNQFRSFQECQMHKFAFEKIPNLFNSIFNKDGVIKGSSPRGDIMYIYICKDNLINL